MWEGFELALWLTRWGSQTSDSLQVWETKGTRWPAACGSMMQLLQVQICFKRFLTFRTAFFCPWCFSLSCASCSCSLGYIPNQKSNVVQVKLRLGSSRWYVAAFLKETSDWRGSALCLLSKLVSQAGNTLLAVWVSPCIKGEGVLATFSTLPCSGLASPGRLSAMREQKVDQFLFVMLCW